MTPAEEERAAEKEKFVDRFKLTLTGLGIYGIVADAGQPPLNGPLQKAHHAIEVPQKVEVLLRSMFDFLKPNGVKK